MHSTIITDIAAGFTADDPEYSINIAVTPYVKELDERICLLLKDKLGYKDVKGLIEESGPPLTFKPLFVYSYDQLEASAAAEREESEREAAEYSQMLSHLSKSRKSNEDSDDDSLDDDYEDDDEEADEEGAEAAHEAEDSKQHDEEGAEGEAEGENDEKKDDESAATSRTAGRRGGVLHVVGGSFKFLVRGLSGKNLAAEPALDDEEDKSHEGDGDHGHDDDEDEDDGDGDNNDGRVDKGDTTEHPPAEAKNDDNPTYNEAKKEEDSASTAAAAPALSSKTRSSRSMLSAIGGSIKRMTLSRRGSSAKDLGSQKSDEAPLEGEGLLSAGSSSKTNKQQGMANTTADSKNEDEDVAGSSAKAELKREGSNRSAKLGRQKSLGYDFDAVMRNLDANEGDSSDEESRKKKRKGKKHHHRGDEDDEEEEREIVIDKTPIHSGIQVIYDAQYQRHFKYNLVSGRSSWGIEFRGAGGGVIKQIWR